MNKRADPVEYTTYNYRRGGCLRIVGLGFIFIFGWIFLFLNRLVSLAEPTTLFGNWGLRYLIWPGVVVMFLLIAGARYVQVAYGLNKFSSAFSYLTAWMFFSASGEGSCPPMAPHVEVMEGAKKVQHDDDNIVEIIGGPVCLVVHPGNVVLVENLLGGFRVFGPGRHFISRTETVKEVMDLDERDVQGEEISAMTKDGIPVKVRDVRYRYRLWQDPDTHSYVGGARDNRFVYDSDAVRDMTYNRLIGEDGIASWDFGVQKDIENAIKVYIQNHFVDHLTAPIVYGNDPRGDIYKEVHSEFLRKKLRLRGAELTWIDIGHFEVQFAEIDDQRVDAWQAKWIGDAEMARALGESRRAAYLELGRAEAQAEILTSIMKGLEDIQPSSETKQQMRAIYLARIAQLLDVMRN